MMVSNTLYHMLSSEMGLWSAGLWEGGVVLGSSMMLASFIAYGTLPSSQTR